MMIKSEIYKGYRIEVTQSDKGWEFKIYCSARDNPPAYSGWNTKEIAFDVACDFVDRMTSPDYRDLDYQDPKEFPDFQG